MRKPSNSCSECVVMAEISTLICALMACLNQYFHAFWGCSPRANPSLLPGLSPDISSLSTGQSFPAMENESTPGRKTRRYVGLKANLRKPAVLLSTRWSDLVRRLNVCQALALANNLFRCRTGVPGRRVGCLAKAQRQPRYWASRGAAAGLLNFVNSRILFV